MTRQPYDLAVIGSGPGGYRAAILAALRGLSVTIIEKADWGGCCLNRGCVPKKDWYHTARLIAYQRHFAGRGISGALQGDMDMAWEHQERVVKTVQDSYLDYMRNLKVATIEGHGRFLDPETLEVTSANGDTHTLAARHSIIATGGAPQIPAPFRPVSGRILTSDMLYDERPPSGRRVAIIGSGVIACEFAFIFSMLGKEVVWLARSAPLRRMPFSPQARRTLHEAFDQHGIELRQGVSFETAEVHDDGVDIQLGNGETVGVDWVCLGTGRVPYTDRLGLENIGAGTDTAGHIQRNARLQTAAPNVYAIGDVASPEMTANHAMSDASVAVENILAGNTREQRPLDVPVVIYSAIEMARLGMDDDMAEDEGYEPAVGFAAFEKDPCAQGQDETEGFVRLLADMDSGALLGAEVIGYDSGELVQLVSLAEDKDTVLRTLAHGTFNHPARGEQIGNATDTLASKWGLQEEIFGH